MCEINNLSSTNISIEAHINFYFIKRLKENEIKLELFLDWWENQSLDKGLALAMNLYYKKVKHIGYLGSCYFLLV